MNTLFATVLIRGIIEAVETRELARLDPKWFTRDNKMPFPDLLQFMLDPAKESLQIKLNNFLKALNKKKMTISRQAISTARKHFDHSPFEKMTRTLVSHEYSGNFPLKTWNRWHVFGIDGSTIILPTSEELKETYGVVKNQSEKKPVCARISILCDVLHDWILDASINPYNGSERKFAESHADFIKSCLFHLQKVIILFDRGYPSLGLVKHLDDGGIYFLMRCQKNWVAEVRDAPMGDSTQILRNGVKIRVYKFNLPSGMVETLVTNAFDIPADNLPELYFLRWHVEGKYDVLKNKLELENFSGTTNNAILQDFWISITLSIIVSIVKEEANEKLQERLKDKDNLLEQKPNVSQLVGSLKSDFVLACRLPTDELRKEALDDLIDVISRSVTTVRPDREPHERKGDHKKKQYPMNRKSNI
jgi:hypothetical protein